MPMVSEDSTRQQILDAAYHLFVEKGFQGSSMRDIADKAGIKAASIYNHFEGKEAIFKEVFVEKHPLFRLLEILNKVKGETAEELLTNQDVRRHRASAEFAVDRSLKFAHAPAGIVGDIPGRDAEFRRVSARDEKKREHHRTTRGRQSAEHKDAPFLSTLPLVESTVCAGLQVAAPRQRLV